jgi:hypothetical protein
MLRIRRVWQVVLLVLVAAAVDLHGTACDLATADIEATSGDPERIRKAIDIYLTSDTSEPEVQWRLIRAYYNYYDELTDLDRRKGQRWAADKGYAFAKSAYAAHPENAEIVYYYAAIGLCYLDFHRLKALFLINDLLSAFEKARRLDPTLDDAGPDRNLGLLYHELPRWPFGGDRKKALRHLEAATIIAPQRAANRLPLAKMLAEEGRFEEGWQHIEFIRAGNFKVSSPHWHAIYMRRVEDVAQDFPQSGTSRPKGGSIIPKR